MKKWNPSEFQIEKNVPIPKNGLHGRNKYPWREMKVGDSFLFAKDITKATAYANAHAASRAGLKFLTRRTEKGFRCWRVE
jgi:hypothetical protein